MSSGADSDDAELRACVVEPCRESWLIATGAGVVPALPASLARIGNPLFNGGGEVRVGAVCTVTILGLRSNRLSVGLV